MGQDANHDGKIDTFKVQIGATDVKAVTAVNILLEFTYTIEVRRKHRSWQLAQGACPACTHIHPALEQLVHHK